MKKEGYVMVCPECGSKDVSYNLGIEATASGFSTFTYKCNECAHSAQVFPKIIAEEVKKFKKNTKK